MTNSVAPTGSDSPRPRTQKKLSVNEKLAGIKNGTIRNTHIPEKLAAGASEDEIVKLSEKYLRGLKGDAQIKASGKATEGDEKKGIPSRAWGGTKWGLSKLFSFGGLWENPVSKWFHKGGEKEA